MHPEFKSLLNLFVTYVADAIPETQEKVNHALSEFASATRRLKDGVEDSVTGDRAKKLFSAVTQALNNLREQANKLVTDAGVRAFMSDTFHAAFVTLMKLELITTAQDRLLSIKNNEGPKLVKKAQRALKDLQLQWSSLDGAKAKELMTKSIYDLTDLSTSLKDGSQAKVTQAYATTVESIQALRAYVAVKKVNSLHYVDVAIASLRDLDLSYKGRLAVFVQDRVFLGAKYIDRTVGVSNTVVSIDHKYELAPKLESATKNTLEKLHIILGNEKVVAVVRKACTWDDHYSSGKIQDVTIKGYGAVTSRISELWSDYKLQRMPPVAA